MVNILLDEQEMKTPTPSVLTVEQLNHQIRQLIEGELPQVWVRGEISNFKAHSSGHFYFSLKDAKSQVKAVMFRGHNSRLKFKPHDGLDVLLRGRVTVYEPRGDYQIACDTMEPVGAGALQKAFEQLKAKLKAEGLFEENRKKAIPLLPQHVAIVTSPTGAAIQDMLNILSRRNKTVQITLIPTLVQGESAAPQIIQAMTMAFRLPNVDVIIIGRGGGSMEDLWCFNDEMLARTIAQSPIPVISAVGHEIDFTIADFVADLRAPTPSAAAELVVKSSHELVQKLSLLDRLLAGTIKKQLSTDFHRLMTLSARLVDPRRHLQDLIQKSDDLAQRLFQAVDRHMGKKQIEFKILHQRIPSPQKFLERFHFRTSKALALLDGLSPLQVIKRGYSLTAKDGRLIKDAGQVKIKDEISVYLTKGQITAQVLSLSEKEPPWILKKN